MWHALGEVWAGVWRVAVQFGALLLVLMLLRGLFSGGGDDWHG